MVKELYKRKLALPSEAKKIILECLLFFLALFLTPVKFIFGTLPFGFVLCTSAKKDSPFAFVGAILSCIFFIEDKGVYIIAFVSLFILRTLGAFLKKPEGEIKERFGVRLPHILNELFCENIFLRVLISLAAAFGVGIYYTVIGGYMAYDIFSLVFFVVCCPLLTYLASGAWEKGFSKDFYVGLSIIGFMAAFALRGHSLGMFDFSVFISFAIALYVTKNASCAWGAVLSALLSLCIEPRFSLSLVICALVFGILCNLSTLIAIICAAILSVSYSIWAGGYDAFTYIVPELVGACVLSFPVLQLNLLPAVKIRSGTQNSYTDFSSKTELKEINERVGVACGAFYNVSKILQGVQSESNHVTLDSFLCEAGERMQKFCTSCPKKEICWVRDKETTERAFRSICEGAYFLGAPLKATLDDKFIHRCPCIEKMSEEAETLYRTNLENGIKNDKLEISACAFELCAKIGSGLQDKGAYSTKNEALSRRAHRALVSSGLCFEGVDVLGEKSLRVVIFGVDTSRSKIPISKIAGVLECELLVSFDEPTVEALGESSTVELSSLPPHKLSYSKRSVSKNDESNGDSLSAFGGGERAFFLISDGMGTGSGARLTSNMCVSFLEAILPATKEVEACLGVLNSFVRAKCDELSSSIDLLQIDSFTGNATFYKSGACPSFIKRGNSVFSVASKTAPIGIMKKLDCERHSFTLEDDDTIVMISDGALSKKCDCSYIEALLEKTDLKEPSEISEEIINEFRKNNEQADDLSVLVIRFD